MGKDRRSLVTFLETMVLCTSASVHYWRCAGSRKETTDNYFTLHGDSAKMILANVLEGNGPLLLHTSRANPNDSNCLGNMAVHLHPALSLSYLGSEGAVQTAMFSATKKFTVNVVRHQYCHM